MIKRDRHWTQDGHRLAADIMTQVSAARVLKVEYS